MRKCTRLPFHGELMLPPLLLLQAIRQNPAGAWLPFVLWTNMTTSSIDNRRCLCSCSHMYPRLSITHLFIQYTAIFVSIARGQCTILIGVHLEVYIGTMMHTSNSMSSPVQAYVMRACQEWETQLGDLSSMRHIV